MHKGKYKIWYLPEAVELNPLVADIKAAFSTVIGPHQGKTVTWFDTFDWRLYRQRMLLQQDQTAWHLVRRDTGDEIASFLERQQPCPRFSSNFPPGRIKTILDPVLGVRALLPLVTLESSGVTIRILNKDEKTVAHVVLDEQKVQDSGPVFRTIALHGIRGYDRQFKAVDQFIQLYGIQKTASPCYAFEDGVRTTGRCPLDYSSKFSISLKPDMPARQAGIEIFKQLLVVMRRNESGMINDFDSEFLHDFRVAIRRTRAGLTQIKGILPPEITRTYTKEFAWLGDITGPTRDLDVYLHYEENYRSRLPQGLHEGLYPFFADIRTRRQIEWKKLVRHLRSDRYRELMRNWYAYLYGDDGGEVSKNSELPIGVLAGKIIFRRYRKIIKDGAAIDPSSPDRHLHSLRIQCKKLRYCLEFFAALFSKDDMRRVVKQLKRLQNNLGDFNDLSIQQEMLHHYLAGLRPGSGKNQKTASAIGGLLTTLHHEQHRVREGFFSRFRKFSRLKNRQLYEGLFGRVSRQKTEKSVLGG